MIIGERCEPSLGVGFDGLVEILFGILRRVQIESEAAFEGIGLADFGIEAVVHHHQPGGGSNQKPNDL